MYTAATADEDLSLGDVGHLLVGLDGLDEFYLELAGIELGCELGYDALATGLALHLLHHTGTNGRHLRTVVRADDGRHQVTAKGGTSHAELGILVLIGFDVELGAVGCQTRLEAGSDARSQVTANGGSTIEHDAGFAVQDDLANGLGILFAEEVLQLGSINHDNLVGTILDKHLSLVLDALTQQHGNNLLTEGVGQVAGLT